MTTSMATIRRMLTPPAVAEHLGISPEKTIAFIRSGELVAIDISLKPGIGRPRYRIDPVDLAAFEAARRVAVAPPLKRRRKDPAVREYF